MSKRLITLISALTLGATLPVFAGPDWQVIEQARAYKQKQADSARKAGTPQQCAGYGAVLLDHGPRAQTTPYLNQQRRERLDVASKACKDAAA
jgi:hypothetical protein